jgi:hypothetical protein
MRYNCLGYCRNEGNPLEALQLAAGMLDPGTGLSSLGKNWGLFLAFSRYEVTATMPRRLPAARSPLNRSLCRLSRHAVQCPVRFRASCLVSLTWMVGDASGGRVELRTVLRMALVEGLDSNIRLGSDFG